MNAMPALFIGHGSPMNTLEDNGYTEAWRAFGVHLPRPKAILCVSAHRYFGAKSLLPQRNLPDRFTSWFVFRTFKPI